MIRGLIIIIGYLIGGFQTAILVGKKQGIDIRDHGSGNAGATNTLRVLGRKSAFIVFVGDALKAILAIIVANLIFKDNTSLSYVIISGYASIGAVIGHNWPIYFQFKGGKGIAVSVASLFLIDYRMGIIAASIFIVCLYFTRYVSLGSILLTISAPISFALLNKGLPAFKEAIMLVLFIPVMAVYQHRANIGRLLKGTESKLGQKNQ